MKMHLNLTTADLDASVAFYSVLLDSKPAKRREDYALFITEQPGLELAVDLAESVSPARDAHYGICVDSVEEVDAAIRRLEEHRLVASVGRSETCCYATQTKVWTTDPDGRRWEVYTVHEETDERNESEEADSGAVCC